MLHANLWNPFCRETHGFYIILFQCYGMSFEPLKCSIQNSEIHKTGRVKIVFVDNDRQMPIENQIELPNDGRQHTRYTNITEMFVDSLSWENRVIIFYFRTFFVVS